MAGIMEKRTIEVRREGSDCAPRSPPLSLSSLSLPQFSICPLLPSVVALPLPPLVHLPSLPRQPLATSPPLDPYRVSLSRPSAGLSITLVDSFTSLPFYNRLHIPNPMPFPIAVVHCFSQYFNYQFCIWPRLGVRFEAGVLLFQNMLMFTFKKLICRVSCTVASTIIYRLRLMAAPIHFYQKLLFVLLYLLKAMICLIKRLAFPLLQCRLSPNTVMMSSVCLKFCSINITCFCDCREYLQAETVVHLAEGLGYMIQAKTYKFAQAYSVE